MDINDIIEAIKDNWIRISDHADEEAEDDGLALLILQLVWHELAGFWVYKQLLIQQRPDLFGVNL